jgi:hypothetical protein
MDCPSAVDWVAVDDWATELHLPVIKTSALTGQNIDALVELLAKTLVDGSVPDSAVDAAPVDPISINADSDITKNKTPDCCT